MAVPVIRLLKFTGTISLGLLTGVSFTLSRLSFPTLLHLPTASNAAQAHIVLKHRSRRTRRFLSTLAGFSLTAAFLLSPRRRQHPYLLWTSAVCALGASGAVESISRWITPVADDDAIVSEVKTKTRAEEELQESAVLIGAEGRSGSSASGEDSEAEEAVNGEVVRKGLERGRFVEGLRAGIQGLAFAMAVVGIWGDGA